MSATAETPLAQRRAAPAGPRLRRDSLSFLETIGQSVANVAPTLTPTLNIVIVAGLAGIGSWLAYLVAGIGMLFVAGNIGALARRHPLAGSYFVYIGRTLGPAAGMIAGWSMVGAYVVTAVATVFGGQIFLADLLRVIAGGKVVVPGPVFDLAFIGGVFILAYRDIRISSRVGLALEFLSLGIIVAITATVFAQHGGFVDRAQLAAPATRIGGVMAALAFAVFSFVGFESAATLARESRQPTRAIPRAVTLSAGLAGLFFVVIAYAMVVVVGDDTAILAKSASPFTEIATRAHLAWAAGIVYFAATISVFACCLASINAGSRLIFSMGRYEFLPRRMGSVHARHQTPNVAIAAGAAFTLVACLLLGRLDPVDAFGYTGTFATFGFLVIYLLISVAAPLDLYRAGEARPRHLIVGTVGAVLMGFVIFGSLYPVPDYPYDLLPYLFALYLLFGAFLYGVVAARAPHARAGLAQDLEL